LFAQFNFCQAKTPSQILRDPQRSNIHANFKSKRLTQQYELCA